MVTSGLNPETIDKYRQVRSQMEVVVKRQMEVVVKCHMEVVVKRQMEVVVTTSDGGDGYNVR